jgi:PqqD family protein of HPr-rel-A system
MDRGRWLSHEWDDGCVLFDRSSGDTHALDPLCAEVLGLIEAGCADPLLISEKLAAELDIEAVQLLPGVEAAMTQLRQRGLA